MSIRVSSILCFMALALAACAPERPSDAKSAAGDARAGELKQQPVAQINSEVITLEEFERRIEGLAPYARVRYSTRAKQQEFLDSLVVFELLADEAERQGLGDDPAVIHAMKEVMVRRLLDQELKRRVTMKDISDAEVQRVYEAERDQYERPEQRRAIALVMDDEAALKKLIEDEGLARMEDVASRQVALRRLAAKHSVDAELAKVGGDLGYLDPPHVAKSRVELSTALFGLSRVGDMTAVVKHGERWYALMLTDIKPAYRQPIEEVTRQLRTRLYDERRRQVREELVKELRQKARVQVFDDVLARAKPPAPAGHLIKPEQQLKELPMRGLKPAQDTAQPQAEPQAPAEPTEQPKDATP